ncbi:MAG: 23S rRNA (pseudouridine(1915)-N(3))-methyltransferase RlmH, partial [Muribaculaceae bacterium]|nr:23S rRNA (pseudouridine(1915)-N(3))-methyltransferase RlmH [Muribaculaceae bacterium]
VPYKITELPDVKNAGRLPEAEQKELEGKQILSKLTASDYVILLDENGEEYTSRSFSKKLEKWMGMGRKRIFFVVGGPYGFSEAVYERSEGMVSLSKMTFNHEMVRLFFTEQIYRAMTILRGEPYHHD